MEGVVSTAKRFRADAAGLGGFPDEVEGSARDCAFPSPPVTALDVLAVFPVSVDDPTEAIPCGISSTSMGPTYFSFRRFCGDTASFVGRALAPLGELGGVITFGLLFFVLLLGALSERESLELEDPLDPAVFFLRELFKGDVDRWSPLILLALPAFVVAALLRTDSC